MFVKNIIIVFHASIFELKNNFENDRMKHDIINQFFIEVKFQRSQVFIDYYRFYSALPITENNFNKMH